MRSRRRVGGRMLGDDAGVVSAFLLASMIGLMAVVGLALDPGEAFATKIRAIGQAEEAARAGAQQINLTVYRETGQVVLDSAAAERAARGFLAAREETGIVAVAGARVTVTITTSYRTQLWRLVGVDAIAVHASGSAVAQVGVTTPVNP